MTGAALRAARALLFDLDGTLLDTAPDMVATLNVVRREERLEPLPYARARAHVSHGVNGLLRIAFGPVAESRRERLHARFLELYAMRLTDETRLFPGMADVLSASEANAMPWGVVTNKPSAFTGPLLEHLGLARRCACVVSGDTVSNRKPHPAPLLHAANLLGIGPGEAIYVGDAERDIQAGRAAGMQTVAALYGYIPPEEDPRGWGADARIDAPLDLIALVLADAAARPETME